MKGNRCFVLLFILAVMILVACAPTSPSTASELSQRGLEAVLQAPDTLPNGNVVEVEFTLTNHSDTGVYILNWYTPLEGIYGEIFRVERGDGSVPYRGPLVMREAPILADYVFLERGASVSATVNLATVYSFSEPGTYTISFISPRISHMATSEDEMATSVDDLGPVEIHSERITIEIEE